MRLIGSLSGEPSLQGSLSGVAGLSGGLSLAAGTATTYAGPYEVTPRLTAQTLETQAKLMADDVTVYEIPVVRTSNLYDGITVVIG